MKRDYHTFTYKDSNFRISSDLTAVVCAEIVRQRELLEAYIVRQPLFKSSLVPMGLTTDAPEIAQDMNRASGIVGVGPLAAVAGAIAQRGALAAIAVGAKEAIVENGGDIFAVSRQPLLVGLHAGEGSPFNRMALKLDPQDMPRAICSSSSRMGHSLSLGACDLATVVAQNAALADAAATMACNMVKTDGDISQALDYITSLPGIDGALIINQGRIGLKGSLPELIRNDDASTEDKITRAIQP